MEHEAHGDDLSAHLHSEDSHKVGLELFQFQGQDGFISVGQVGVHAHHHTVGDDGEDDAVFEGPAVDEPDKDSPAEILFINLLADVNSVMMILCLVVQPT